MNKCESWEVEGGREKSIGEKGRVGERKCERVRERERERGITSQDGGQDSYGAHTGEKLLKVTIGTQRNDDGA